MFFGLAVAFFAGQNSSPITLTLSHYHFTGIPLYIAIAGALLTGFIISWLFSLIDSVFNIFTLRGKDSKIRQSQHKVDKLEDRIHELELENSRLRTGKKQVKEDENYSPDYRPSLFDRLAHNDR